MDIPSHAAVKETVDVLRSASSPVPDSKIKFANALLRRISIDGKNVLEKETKASDNIAPWLLRRLTEDWGEEEALKISDAFMTQAPIHLSVKYPNTANSEPPLKQKIEEVRDALNGQTVILPNGSLRAGDDLGGQVSNWPLYDEGAWWVQDASATLPAKVLFSSLQGNANMSDLHVIDMCAAPGGKTAQLISMGIGKVTAVENSEKRTRRLKKNLDRLAMSNQCNIVVADGSSWIPDDAVHGILLDVPCSATGTGSKRPDVLRRSEDLQELLDTQERLANNCADKILAPGGILVYATCSILKDESESQVVKLLSRSNGAKLETVPIQAEEVPGFESCIDEQGWLRVLPGTLSESMGPCDGFFVARLKRTC
jgi:16S rRNA (cytosine967-C5)-methyltransferase